jgi:hypothetical protein
VQVVQEVVYLLLGPVLVEARLELLDQLVPVSGQPERVALQPLVAVMRGEALLDENMMAG